MDQLTIQPQRLRDGLNSQSSNSLQRAGWITNRINRLISAYRRDDYTDAASFIAQAGVVLEGYSDDVIEYVTAPQTGLQRTQKFAPTIAEIAQACDMRTAAVHRQKELNDWHDRKRKSDQTKALARPAVTTHPGTLSYGEHLERCAQLKLDARVRGRSER